MRYQNSKRATAPVTVLHPINGDRLWKTRSFRACSKLGSVEELKRKFLRE